MAPQPRRPLNVVYILSDDTWPTALEPYGGNTPTPHILRLARRGMMFHRTYCSSSVCTPSRFSHLTGQFASRCNDPEFLRKYPTTEPHAVGFNVYLNDQTSSAGFLFQRNGYHTGFAGKWHVGHGYGLLDTPRFDPTGNPEDPDVDARLKRLQDVLCEEVKSTAGFDYAGGVIWGNNESQPLECLRYHHNEWSVQCAVDFLESCSSDQPFFLHFASTCIHGPGMQDTLDRDVRYTPGGKLDAPPGCIPDRRGLMDRARAAGLPGTHETLSFLSLDDQVGAIVNKLEEMGVLENTLIVYSSDHNTEPGKSTCYETGIHIPLIIQQEGAIEPGTESSIDVQNLDILPTIADFCGLDIPDDVPFDGISFRRALEGDPAPIHDDLFFENGFTRAVRTSQWKYIALRYPKPLIEKMKSGELDEAPNHLNQRLQGQAHVAIETHPHYFDADQLYDYKADPDEQQNLAYDPKYANVLVEMKSRLQKHLEGFAHPFDLNDTEFLESDQFKALAQKVIDIGTSHIYWWPKTGRG